MYGNVVDLVETDKTGRSYWRCCHFYLRKYVPHRHVVTLLLLLLLLP